MPKIERPWCLPFLCLAAILIAVSQQFSLAQTPPPPPKSAEPGAKPAGDATTAPGLRATPPSVVEVTDPSLPPGPKPPEQVNPPPLLPEQQPGVPFLFPGMIQPVPAGPGTPLQKTAAPNQGIYRVGKIIIKYGTDVRKRNPSLPTEAQLAGTVLSLEKAKFSLGEGLFHIPKPNEPRLLKRQPDLALHPELAPVPGNGAGAAPAVPETKAGEKTKGKDAGKPAAGTTSEAKDKKTTAKDSGKPGKKTDAKPAPAPAATGQIVQMKVSDFGEPQWVSAMGLLDVYDSIVDRLTDRGLIGVYLMAQVDPHTGMDLRKETFDIEVQVFVSEVAKIRTIARRIPFKTGDLPKINDDDAPDGQPVKDPKHLWIKAKSPVFVSGEKKGGGLLMKPKLQDYLNRLNRFPGRRVDAAVNATGETGKVMLDYLIREQKPWMVYFQEANNGTKATGEWRSRLGAECRQLANMDDILRLEYVTTDFSGFNSALLSYQFALDKPDVLKMRIYGLYGNYSAQDVGFALASFKGDSITAGGAITWTPLYWHGFPLDLTLGAEFLRVSVENPAFGGKASGEFILPYAGFGTERVTDRFSFAMDAQVKGSLSGPDSANLVGLGRFNPDRTFYFMNGNLSTSVFLEPLLLGSQWGDLGKDGEKWWHGILANELAITARGQYTFADRRLIPQLEFVAGGFNTVRGYPETFTSADSGYVASLEYRLHVPRLFKPSDAAKKAKAAKADGKPATAQQASPVRTALRERGESSGSSFRLAPPTAGAGADWDFIVRLFLDHGQTFNNQIQPIIERNRTLTSAGAGIEIQLFKPIYMILRADYGFVLQAQHDFLLNPIDVGDTRLHLSGTIAF